MKFIFLLIAGILLIVGYIILLPAVTLCGSILYILIQIVSLLTIVRLEALCRREKYDQKPFKSNVALMNQLSTFCELIIFLFSSISFLFFPSWFPKGLWIGSMIVTFGQLLIWIVAGLLGRNIKHVPIKMGFSSWYIQHNGQ